MKTAHIANRPNATHATETNTQTTIRLKISERDVDYIAFNVSTSSKIKSMRSGRIYFHFF